MCVVKSHTLETFVIAASCFLFILQTRKKEKKQVFRYLQRYLGGMSESEFIRSGIE